jgi:flagellar hook-basal body complex protein FliE
MSPISAFPSSTFGAMPNVNLMTPEVSPLAPAETASPSPLAPAQPSGDSFATMLGKMVSDVNAQQGSSMQTIAALQSGQNVPLHQAVIAMEEANVSFQLMVEVRSRMLDAYQEIMRMQV